MASLFDKIELKLPDLLKVETMMKVSLGASPSEEELRERQERYYRSKATINLWRRAISELRVRHPDPHVLVEIDVRGYENEQAHIRFTMWGMSDTGDQDKHIGVSFGFGHSGTPSRWPGLTVARQYITALWCLYLIHEAQELVTFRGIPGRTYYADTGSRSERRVTELSVIDPHNELGPNQRALSMTSDVAATLDWALGFGEGRRAVEINRERAEAELKNETDFVAGRCAVWQ